MLLRAINTKNSATDCASTCAGRRTRGERRYEIAIEDRMIRVAEFAEILGVSQTTFYRMLKAGVLPQPINIGLASKKINVWPLSTVNECIRRIKENATLDVRTVIATHTGREEVLQLISEEEGPNIGMH